MFYKKGDVFLTRTSEIIDELGMSSVALKDYPKATFNGFTKRLRTKPEFSDKVDARYIGYYLRSRTFRNAVNSMSDLTTRASLNNEMISKLPLILPEYDQQIKISSHLYDFDAKIETNEAIIQNLTRQKELIFRRYFVGTHEGFSPKLLVEVTTQLKSRSTTPLPVLSAINSGKLVKSDEFFTKKVYSKDTSKYIIVPENSFAYNPARINIGSIGINDLREPGCVSPVYVAFSVEEFYTGFFAHYFKSDAFKNEASLRANGSVRQTLNYDEFSQIKVSYPDIETAKKFNVYWVKTEQRIFDLKKENETLEAIKDRLIEKLLSGQIVF